MLFKGTHLQFVAHDVQHVATRHDAQLGVHGLDDLQVTVVHTIQRDGVYVFNYDMLLYHSLFNLVQNY